MRLKKMVADLKAKTSVSKKFDKIKRHKYEDESHQLEEEESGADPTCCSVIIKAETTDVNYASEEENKDGLPLQSIDLEPEEVKVERVTKLQNDNESEPEAQCSL